MESTSPDPGMGMIRPFGPSIVKVRLPEMLVQELNAYVDRILADKAKAAALDHGARLAGNVHQEFLLEPDYMQEIRWVEFIGLICNEWLQKTNGRELKSIHIIHSWIVRQFQHEYNPMHHHSGHISGVGYLKVPKDMGKTVQPHKNANSNGNLLFMHGSPNLFCNAKFEVRPQVGDFYLFPAHLQHIVYPFSGTDEERRSVSFNAVIDAEAAAF